MFIKGLRKSRWFQTVLAGSCMAGFVTTGEVLAQSDAPDRLHGAKLFVTCAMCHQIGADAENDVGPVLNGVVGRRAASQSQFSYSAAMGAAGASGLVWTPEALDQYLENPRRFMPGTTMAHAGLKSAEDRAAVIAYLQAQQP